MSLTLLSLTFTAAGASSATPIHVAPAAAPPRLSAALEQMLRDEVAAGQPVPLQVIRQWNLDLPELGSWFVEAPSDHRPTPLFRIGRAAVISLAPDVQVNDKSGDASCAANCNFAPLTQSETSIAVSGSNLLASWNDGKGTCTGGATQGYGYSFDMGATWTDGGYVPSLATGGRYTGDPVCAVNPITGDFYICGLYGGGAFGRGIALARGHFSAGSLVFDLNTQIAVGGTNLLDKDWIACDPLTGYVYVTYSNFVGGTTPQIEMIRSTTNGVSWDAPIVLNSPGTSGSVTSARPIVAPGGVLYVMWWEGLTIPHHFRIRRSDDFGASFGPEAIVASFYPNDFSGAPGFRRGFNPRQSGIAVDRSGGPHDGRVYVTWSESVNYWDTPFYLTSPRTEVENNSFFANATPFEIGDVLRGEIASTGGADVLGDVDLFKFSGLRGQTVYCQGDSMAAGSQLIMRLICASDTSSLNNTRFLTQNLSGYPTAGPGAVFTLPATGAYYLMITSAIASPTGGYRILTAFDSPSPGERARDHRDQFVAYSDDGLSWSVPAMLDDSDPWFDGVFPEVTVDGLGRVHCFWQDCRDDLVCGAQSSAYMTSSGDGGVTWGPNRRVSDEESFWSLSGTCGINQGDYQGIASEGSNVYPCWSDTRLGDPDVFMERSVFASSRLCPGPQAIAGGSNPNLTFTLTNSGNAQGQFGWTLEDDNGWLTSAVPGAKGTADLAAGGFEDVQAQLRISSVCYPAAQDHVRFITSDLHIPGRADTCTTVITCTATTHVPAEVGRTLALAPPQPNPANQSVSVGFSLSRNGRILLTVYGPNGARIRSLVDNDLSAGTHERVWDSCDNGGRHVAAGIYFVQLEAEGRRLRRSVAIIR
jgi:hypothetical protein